MAKETDTKSDVAPRDEDSMNYLVTIVLGMLAWIISGYAVYGAVGALVGWMVDEWRATRRRAVMAEKLSEGEDP